MGHEDHALLVEVQRELTSLRAEVGQLRQELKTVKAVNSNQDERLVLSKNWALWVARAGMLIEDIAGGADIDTVTARAKLVYDGAKFCLDACEAARDARDRKQLDFDTGGPVP